MASSLAAADVVSWKAHDCRQYSPLECAVKAVQLGRNYPASWCALGESLPFEGSVTIQDLTYTQRQAFEKSLEIQPGYRDAEEGLTMLDNIGTLRQQRGLGVDQAQAILRKTGNDLQRAMAHLDATPGSSAQLLLSDPHEAFSDKPRCPVTSGVTQPGSDVTCIEVVSVSQSQPRARQVSSAWDDDEEPSQPSAPTLQSSPSQPVINSDQEKFVERIVEMGFQRHMAVRALEECNWNLERAVSFLMHM